MACFMPGCDSFPYRQVLYPQTQRPSANQILYGKFVKWNTSFIDG